MPWTRFLAILFPAAGGPLPVAQGVVDLSARIHAAVERFQAGGEDKDEAFRTVFDCYYRPLQRFFRRKGLATDLCLDLTQETLLGIYRGLETYRPEARFEAWLYKVASTTHLKWLRARRTAKRNAAEVSTESPEIPEPVLAERPAQLDTLVEGERRQALATAIAELPEQMRRSLVLRLYHDLSYREIAVALRVSVDTVKTHLRQGRQRVGEALNAESDPDGADSA